jgi:hypothetical protein
MPGFWWARRRKPWIGSRFRRRRRRPYYRRRKRFYKRRRAKPVPRRRRYRRKRKVRRKKKRIHIAQWQPESIVKCKIKGHTVLVLGADGRQNRCYTYNKYETVAPKTPMGGGFGIESFTLRYLYDQYKAHNNTWSKTNSYKDVCRYLGCKFTAFRHPKQDFIIRYDIQPPFTLTKFTHMQTHPYMMLQHKHHKVILSKFSKPNGKLFKTIRVKPPKQTDNKWYFQKEFSKNTLVTISATAANLNYSYLQCCNENLQLNLLYLDINFYQVGNWGLSTFNYLPYHTAVSQKTFYAKSLKQPNGYTIRVDGKNYNDSVSFEKGWFQPPLLQALKFYTNESYNVVLQEAVPINYCIYNPALDEGPGNKIFLHSLTHDTYSVPQDADLIITNTPLWLGLWGFLDWIIQRKTKEYFSSHCLCIVSKALLVTPSATASTVIIPIDRSMQNGKTYFDNEPTLTQKARWFPTIYNQLQTINDIVETGPYVPKLTNDRDSTWELKCKYTFNFKWGGPQVHDPTVNDPQTQGFATTTNLLKETVQVCNPEKQKPETMFHEWDLRRGMLKESAFKRMFENLSSATDVSKSPPESPQKKRQKLLPCLQTQDQKEKEVQECLQELFEENIYQETQDIQQLIQQQHHKQQRLKLSIYKLLTDLKQQQNMLQLHTGCLN